MHLTCSAMPLLRVRDSNRALGAPRAVSAPSTNSAASFELMPGCSRLRASAACRAAAGLARAVNELSTCYCTDGLYVAVGCVSAASVLSAAAGPRGRRDPTRTHLHKTRALATPL